MSIVSISKGSHCRGAEVAEKVAARLGYACLAREVVLEASEEYNVPELKLIRAIEDPPTFIDRLTHGRARFVTYIRAALLRSFLEDNLVYHGLAGHFFLQDIGHALKIRIIADIEDRVSIVMERDEVTAQEAREILEKSDRGRRQWGLHLYGVDPEDPSLYDTVIHVGKMGTDGATDMICNMVEQPTFETTPESQAALEDLALAASVEAILYDAQPEQRDVEVSASNGQVLVRFKRLPRFHGGTDGDFRKHYVDDLRRRLLGLSLGLQGFKALEIEFADH